MCEMSNEGLATVDNNGTVRLWETGVANLERSLEEWRRMLGASGGEQLTIERDRVKVRKEPLSVSWSFCSGSNIAGR